MDAPRRNLRRRPWKAHEQGLVPTLLLVHFLDRLYPQRYLFLGNPSAPSMPSAPSLQGNTMHTSSQLLPQRKLDITATTTPNFGRASTATALIRRAKGKGKGQFNTSSSYPFKRTQNMLRPSTSAPLVGMTREALESKKLNSYGSFAFDIDAITARTTVIKKPTSQFRDYDNAGGVATNTTQTTHASSSKEGQATSPYKYMQALRKSSMTLSENLAAKQGGGEQLPCRVLLPVGGQRREAHMLCPSFHPYELI